MSLKLIKESIMSNINYATIVTSNILTTEVKDPVGYLRDLHIKSRAHVTEKGHVILKVDLEWTIQTNIPSAMQGPVIKKDERKLTLLELVDESFKFHTLLTTILTKLSSDYRVLINVALINIKRSETDHDGWQIVLECANPFLYKILVRELGWFMPASPSPQTA